MIVAESHRGRRLLLSLDRGAELFDVVAAECRARGVRSGVLTAYGTLEEAEVREFDATRRSFHAPRRFSGSLTVMHLGGHLSERSGAPHLEASCALSREGDSGVSVVGGRLVRARVHSVQVVIDCFDDVVIRSGYDPAGLPQWQEILAEQRGAAGAPPPGPPVVAAAPVASPAPAPSAPSLPRPTPSPVAAAAVVAAPVAAPPPPPSPLPPGPATPAPRFEAAPTGRVVTSRPIEPAPAAGGVGGVTWAEVAARSAAQGPVEESLGDSDGDDDEPIRAGDVIEHPRFGHCEVERIEGGGEYAQIRLRNRRLVRLSLDVIQLVRDGRGEGGRRRFRAEVST